MSGNSKFMHAILVSIMDRQYLAKNGICPVKLRL